MLRLMSFGVYFERILKIKWLSSYRNNYSYTLICLIKGLGGLCSQENFENIWCSLMRFGVYFYRKLCLKNFKNIHFYKKIIVLVTY